MTESTLKSTIHQQREMLTGLLSTTMHDLAFRCADIIGHRIALESLLTNAFPALPYCKHLYVLNQDSIQLTDNITREGNDHDQFARDRSTRPYMQDILSNSDFRLSDAYISRNKKRPSLTAVQVIRNRQGKHVGYLGADFDTRELPHSNANYTESDNWRQIKGDPAIRDGLFLQSRVESIMDSKIDQVLPLMNELLCEHGVFHGKLHFSSNRATIWTLDDPYVYRILNIDELTDPNICLVYPNHPYAERAIVPAERIKEVFAMFKSLRFADETVYLRAGSLNIINGMVGLNFSCDGSHYMRFDEFLDKNEQFWFGGR